MVFKIEITDATKLDLEKALNYYNSKSPGLGKKFYTQFKDAIKKIKSNPFYFSYYKNPFRRVLLKDFPYLVMYKIYNNTAIITGVLFEMINPEKITDRTK